MQSESPKWPRRFSRWLTPTQDATIPTQDAGAKALFSKVAWIAGACCSLYATALLALGASYTKLIAPVSIAFAAIASVYLLRILRPRLAFYIFISSVWLAVAMQSAVLGGLQNPVLHIDIILVILSGWLIGLTEAGLLLFISLTWVLFLLLYGGPGQQSPQQTASELSQSLAMTAIWIAGYFVIRLILLEHKQRLARINALETSLLEKMEQLDAQSKIAILEKEKVVQLLRASPLPITVANFQSGVYVDVNPAWERYFGYALADVRGKTSIEMGFWRDISQRHGWIDRFNEFGRVSGYEVAFQLKDGRVRDFLLSSERFQYGEEDCVLTMSVDITDRKLLEIELRQLNATLESRVAERTQELVESNRELIETMSTLRFAQAELIQSEKLASLGSLVAGLSHEINTPIGNALVTSTSISDDVFNVKALVDRGTLRRSDFSTFISRQEEGAELIRRSLERAANLISSFKQVAVDQTTEQRRVFDIAVVTKEILDTQLPGLKKKGIVTNLQMQFGIQVDSFPGPYGQVVMNCVNNALVHAFEDVEKPQLTITVSSHDAVNVRIEITDNGAGIAREVIGRVFDPFFTTKMGKGGSGIGLAISHRLVTSVLGGKIGVHSNLGEGTTFSISIPRTAPALDPYAEAIR